MVGCIGLMGSSDPALKRRERGSGAGRGGLLDRPSGWGYPLGLGLGLTCWVQCLVLGFRPGDGEAHFPVNTTD